MGIRDIERKIKMKSAAEKKDAELLLTDISNMMNQVKALKQQLKKLEKKWGKEIRTNKEYYQKIAEIRRSLGLPEEIGVYEWKEKPGIKERLLGGQYYDQLATELLEIGRELTKETGGLMSLAELIIRINKTRPGKVVSATDISKALEVLAKADAIPPLKKLDSGVKIVEFIPTELTEDQEIILSLASRQGYITLEEILLKTKWSLERAKRAIEDLVEKGIAIKDTQYMEGTKYWFPGLASF